MNLDGNFPTYEKQEAIKQGVDNIALQIENKDAGKVLKSKTFTANGTFSVPEGVTEVFITGGGAGGGGCIGNIANPIPVQSGKAGGVTSFGSLLTLSGGGGATNKTSTVFQMPGVRGGPGGQTGEVNYASNGITVGSAGGNSGPYFGGIGSTLNNTDSSLIMKGGYCSGGGGLYYGSLNGCGGGGGDFVFDRIVAVTPSTTIPITIGIGGAGGKYDPSGSVVAGDGGNGILTVEWWE